MKKTLFVLVLVVSLFPFSVKGQEEVVFERLVIDIWPEYDRTGVLIIYRGVLSSQVPLPVQVTFQIPAKAGQPNAVAVRGADDQLMSVQYERMVRGNYAEISFTATSQEIQFEYYDPTLEREGDKRTFTYQWPGHHAVDTAVFQVQQPRGSYALEISPAFGESFQGSEGLTYYTMSETRLEEGETQVIRVQYSKSSDSLSVGDQPIQPGTPIEPRLAFSFRGRNLIPWLMAGFGLALILGGIGFYWWFGDKRSPRLILAGERKTREQEPADPHRYCPQCGSRTGENDRFCRVCGQRL
ncbi:MAG: zinc ribbon domain-containing protein [Chloroflexota bacterium]